MPWKVLCPRPSVRDCAKAASRLGPTTPVAPARASVWQAAHLSTNFCLPFARFVPLSLSWQPDRTKTAATPLIITRPLLMGPHPNDRRGRGSRRLGLRNALGLLRGLGGVVRGDVELQPRDAAVPRLRA